MGFEHAIGKRIWTFRLDPGFATYCVIWGKVLEFSESYSFYLQIEDSNTYRVSFEDI